MRGILIVNPNRPKCSVCFKNWAAPTGSQKLEDGSYKYHIDKCRGCDIEARHGRRNANKKQYHKRGREYGKFKDDHCKACGFKGLACQLDVDHIDGNRKNNDIINLQTLCANCHRLKTHQSKDSYSKQWRGHA